MTAEKDWRQRVPLDWLFPSVVGCAERYFGAGIDDSGAVMPGASVEASSPAPSSNAAARW